MHFSTLAAVKSEVRQAVIWYNQQQANLGIEFLQELTSYYHRIKSAPHLFPTHRFYRGAFNVRRALLHRFPYAITYRIQDDHILVIAVSHTKREEDYWLARMEPK